MSARLSPESCGPAPLAALGPAATLLEQVVRESPVGIAVIDPEGAYRSVNPAYARLYGYSPDELLQLRFTAVFPPGDRQRVMKRHLEFLRDGVDLRGESEVIRRDGSGLHVLVESTRVTAPDGQACRMVFVVDITARRRAEVALQQSHQFLTSVIDGLAAMVCVLDGSGVILAVNRAWRDFHAARGGLPAAAPVGSSGVTLNAAAPAADASRFGDQLHEVLAGRLQAFQHEYACHSENERRWFLARVSRIDGSDPLRVLVAHDDITAVRLTAEQVEHNEALLRDLAASLPGVMFRMVLHQPSDWSFVYVSPGVSALYELSPEQVCSDRGALRRCVMADDLPQHDAVIRDAVLRRVAWELEFRIRTASGQVRWIHASATPKADARGSTLWTGMLNDISERKRLHAVLQDSEQTYRTLFETVPQGIVYHGVDGRITSANPAAQRILGLSLEQMQRRSAVDARWRTIREDGSVFPGEELPAIVALATAQPVSDVVVGVEAPGRGRVWILVNATPLFKQGRLDQVYASFEDITQRVHLSNELRRQASTDDLTGAANRRSLIARLQLEFDRFQRHPGTRCCVLAMDLDRFKRVNDAHGHAAGDAVLAHVAQLMRQQTRQVDILGRSGGEEFLLLLPDTELAQALALAERLRQSVAEARVPHGGQALAITLSIGVALMGADDRSADDVLARADRALYAAKAAGRNAVRAQAD